jgi:prevent-host-death family protein
MEDPMTRVSVVQAKANFSRLLAEVEAGQEVVITRRGTAVAKISGVTARKAPPDLHAITAFRAGLTATKPAAAELIRRMRNERY